MNSTDSSRAIAATPGAAASAEGDPNFMTSLARGLAVIRGFAGSRHGLTISQLSQKTGISRAAVRRCLYTLERLGYVGAEGTLYVLRPMILTLGYSFLSSTPVAEAAQPHLDALSKALQESCSLSVLDGDEIVYVARSSVSRIMSINLVVGTRLPAYGTSMGRVLLAHLPAAKLEDYLRRVKMEAFTPRTVTSVERLREILQQVRESGYALVDQELEIGLRSLAVPVRDVSGRVIAAMNIGSQAARVSADEVLQRFLPALQAAAAELGTFLRA
jgi:IclR family pca regulon transcriptional regulator